ncbi:hypothetical protein GCM10029992_03850 [Glycomyces albus]
MSERCGIIDSVPSDHLISSLAADHTGRGADHEPRSGGLRHLRELPARPAERCAWPEWVAEPVRSALAGQGIVSLWPHQAEAATHAFEGRDVVVATGTASGKSLAYLLPILNAAADSAGSPTSPQGGRAGRCTWRRRRRSPPTRPGRSPSSRSKG